MREKAIALALILIAAPLFAHAGEWTTLQPGFSHRTLEAAATSLSGKNPVIQLFRVDPEKFRIRPLVASQGSTLVASDARYGSGALLTINANFFDETGNILGLVLRDGKILSPLRKVSWWGVFFLKGTKAGIVHSFSLVSDPQIVTAIEAGPRLVIDGVLPKLKSSFSRKSAIGINRRGEVILAVSSTPIEAVRFAELLSRSERKGGAGCLQALNLDGGGSTQLSAESGSFKLNVSGFSGVPVLLGVFAR